MTAELLFTICSRAVLPAWILIAFLPRWVWTRKLVFSIWIPGLLAACYIFAFFAARPFPDGANFNSLGGVMDFFQVPYVAVAGWIHYLAFDLFVGAWEARDAERHGINQWLVLPCLFFTLMLGPVGLLMYFVLRAIMRRTATTEELASTA